MKILIATLIFANIQVAYSANWGKLGSFEQCVVDVKAERKASYYNDKMSYHFEVNGRQVVKATDENVVMGDKFLNHFSDEKVNKLCRDEKFLKSYKSDFECTGNIFANHSLKNGNVDKDNNRLFLRDNINISKLSVYKYCQKLENQDEVAAVSSCLVNVRDRLNLKETSNERFSVLYASENTDELFNLCQDPNFRLTFSNKKMNEVNSCFTQKLGEEVFSNSILVKREFRELLSSQYRGALSQILKDKKVSYTNWVESSRSSNNLIPLAVMVYDNCANDVLKGNELHAYYNNHEFIGCLGTLASGENIKKKEAYCGQLVQLKGNSYDEVRRGISRGIASGAENTHQKFFRKTYFGEWMNPELNFRD